MKPIEIDLSKKASLVLATIAPAIFGMAFYIVAQLPVIGDIWWFASPFALLLYWGWVAGMYFRCEVRYVWAVLIANSYGILSFVMYMVKYYGTDIAQGTRFTDQIIFWFTYPLQFLTLSIGGIIHDPESDAMLVFSTQFYGIIFMITAFTIGYFVAVSSSKKQHTEDVDVEEKIKIDNLLQSHESQDSQTEMNQ